MDHHLLSHRILLGTELNKLWSGFLNKLIPYLPIELTMRNSVWLTKCRLFKGKDFKEAIRFINGEWNKLPL